MKRLLAVLFILVALPVLAQEEPQLVLDFEADTTIPGQPLSLSLTVLVPTYLPKAPVWPSLELPNVLVRVASTGPTSQRIGSATWSGVTRRYLITPMIPGNFTLPAQQVSVTWADPEMNAPKNAMLVSGEIAFSGIVPSGAEGLSPFVAARSIELDQTVEGRTEGLQPGESIVRTVTAKIVGTSPMFLPSLLPDHDIPGMRSYVSDPAVETLDDGGALSGTRTEKVTLVTEGGGTGMAPAVELSWFNLDTGTVETTRLDAFPLSVDAPPAASPTSKKDGLDLRRLAFLTAALMIGLAGVWLLVRYGASPAQRLLSEVRTRWQHSELRAWRSLRRVLHQRDYTGLRPAIDAWTRSLGASGIGHDPTLLKLLSGLGAARYSAQAGEVQEDWRGVELRLVELRKGARASLREGHLPPLNQAS